MNTNINAVVAGAVEFEQGSNAWLEWRSGGVGASEVAVLAFHSEAIGWTPCPIDLGDAPKWMSSPLGLWKRKLGLEPGPALNADMARGHALEPGIREQLNREWRSQFEPVCLQVDDGSPLRASLDGVEVTDSGVKVLEIKAPNPLRKRWESCPVYYTLQVAYQRAVLQACGNKVSGSALVAGYENRNPDAPIEVQLFRQESNPELEQWLVELVQFFWDNYVLGRNPPPAVKGDRVEIAGAEAIAQRWLVANAALETAKAELEAARADLLAEVGEIEAGSVAVGGVIITRSDRKGSLDYAAFVKENTELLKGVDLEQYRKAATTSYTVKADPKA
ncbi:YqaJ viral recombinase family protein [Sinimarinibacterium sp. NLF-5-8]|uniref:YqaJ viral recombinase family protein n=1 Tax=Sinimarinibacterium sp. NLF-5-8 TaxID=2698684 RepID=UPI00137BC173|nr:YqaJ viral recombinase family protein [Sinimarinibacterium sp. NLF-5-8]QHS09000.1 hypothetical protein GT972_01815 [Sinimarinibacterium sp. NLF-5-8]